MPAGGLLVFLPQLSFSMLYAVDTRDMPAAPAPSVLESFRSALRQVDHLKQSPGWRPGPRGGGSAPCSHALPAPADLITAAPQLVLHIPKSAWLSSGPP